MFFRALVKLPKPKRFDFPTRYYNAEKEEFEQRVKDIQSQVDAEKNGGKLSDYAQSGYASRISGAFRDNRRRAKGTGGLFSNALVMRLVIMGILGTLMYAYLEFGDRLEQALQGSEISSALGWVLSAMLFFVVIFLLKRR
ncbi:MAG: hypothetical protein MUE85_11715 [Microscillaceae bacterium]|jgi:hypothetical protein|nr:hypothetical protein [Microscillaceae bacterium]